MRLLGLNNFHPPLGYGYGAISADVMRGLADFGHDVTMLVAGGGPDPLLEVKPVLQHVPAAWRKPLPGLRAEAHNQRVVQEEIERGLDGALVWHMRGIGKGALTLLHYAGVPVLYMLGDLWVAYERPGPPVAWRFWQTADRVAPYRVTRRVLGRAAGLGRARLDPPPIAEEGIVCFASEWLRERYHAIGFRPRNAHVVPNGVPAEAFAQEPRLPAGDCDFEIAFAGRLDPTKGADLAIRALAHVPGARLRLAGDGDFVTLHGLVDELGLAGRVEFLGLRTRAQVLELLRSSDAFVMPGRIEEAFGLVYVEAMAAGAVPVGTALGAASEICRDGENSIVVPPGDHEALAAALGRLRDDGELRGRLRAAARATAERYTLEGMLERIEKLLV